MGAEKAGGEMTKRYRVTYIGYIYADSPTEAKEIASAYALEEDLIMKFAKTREVPDEACGGKQ